MRFIKSFASLIPAMQGDRAQKKVEELRKIGEIQTEQEYNEKLQELLLRIPAGDFVPTFEYKAFSPGVSSSDQFNDMINAARDDLEVAFLELSNIYTIIKAHSDLFKDKAIQEIYASVEELKKEIDKLELIASPDNAFDNVFLNTFVGDTYGLQALDRYASELLYDTRAEKRIFNEDNAYIDTQEERISLPLESNLDVYFAEASVINTETTASDFNVQLEDSNISTILDPDTDSNWAYNILKSDELKQGARLGLELNLGDKRIINNLSIYPVSDFPIFLESIEYQTVNGEYIPLPDSSLFNTRIDKPVKVSFNDVIARKLRFKFSQSSSTLFSYNQNDTSITFDDLRRNTSLAANAQTLQDGILSNIQDPDMISVLPITSPATPDYRVLYQYVFALKGIQTGLNSYRSKGYFVSKAYPQATPGLIGFESSEINPVYFDETAGVDALTGTFEYDIVKKDYNSRNDLVRSLTFPILPIGTLEVKERMLFTAAKSIIPLRFLGHTSSGDGSGIILFRNNVPLVRGLDWRFYDRVNNLDDADFNILPSAEETLIEILHSGDVIRNGIYTVEYVPRYIAEDLEIVSPVDGVNYISNNITEHDIQVGIDRVERSDIFVKVTIRNNSFFSNKTPKLESYKLLCSAVDADKYVRI